MLNEPLVPACFFLWLKLKFQPFEQQKLTTPLTFGLHLQPLTVRNLLLSTGKLPPNGLLVVKCIVKENVKSIDFILTKRKCDVYNYVRPSLIRRNSTTNRSGGFALLVLKERKKKMIVSLWIRTCADEMKIDLSQSTKIFPFIWPLKKFGGISQVLFNIIAPLRNFDLVTNDGH